MNHAEKTILHSAITYPSTMGSLCACLHHYFFVVGNGYKWKNGMLVEYFGDIYIDTLPDNLSKWKRWDRNKFEPQFKNLKERFKSFLDEEKVKVIVKYPRRFLDDWQYDLYNHFTPERIYPYCPEYAKLFTIPDDVTDDWNYYAIRAGELALRGLNGTSIPAPKPTKEVKKYMNAIREVLEKQR